MAVKPVTKRFELLGGKHVDENGEGYKAGDIVDSVDDLVTKFPNKFRKVHAFEDRPLVKGKVRIIRKGAAPLANKTEEDARGTDVTGSFEAHEGLKVFKRGGSFHVFVETESEPLNSDGLKKSEVQAFIAKTLES